MQIWKEAIRNCWAESQLDSFSQMISTQAPPTLLRMEGGKLLALLFSGNGVPHFPRGIVFPEGVGLYMSKFLRRGSQDLLNIMASYLLARLVMLEGWAKKFVKSNNVLAQWER